MANFIVLAAMKGRFISDSGNFYDNFQMMGYMTAADSGEAVSAFFDQAPYPIQWTDVDYLWAEELASVDDSLHEALVERREPVLVEDLARSPMIPDEMREHLEAGSGLAVPLLVGNSVLGALTVGSTDVRRFTEDDIWVLKRIASQASIALENARLHASLQALSLTDALTGLPNRRHLQMHLQREVAAAQRGRPLTMLIFDLDNFKQTNDTLGHLAGDDVLRAFAQILAEENRQMNLVARYGGDEFISVLSDSDVEGAAGYAQRIRDRVAHDPILSPNEITVSYGLAWFVPAEMKTMEDLIQAADMDLYSKKDSPRR